MNKTLKMFLLVSLFSGSCIKAMAEMSPKSKSCVKKSVEIIKLLTNGKKVDAEIQNQLQQLLNSSDEIHDGDANPMLGQDLDQYAGNDNEPAFYQNPPSPYPAAPDLQPQLEQGPEFSQSLEASESVEDDDVDQTIKTAIPEIIKFATKGKRQEYINKKLEIEGLWARVENAKGMASFLLEKFSEIKLKKQKVSRSVSEVRVVFNKGRYEFTKNEKYPNPKNTTKLMHQATVKDLMKYVNQKNRLLNDLR